MRAATELTRKLGVRDDELRPLSAGFAGFCAALAGYFLLLPLRDEAGVSLGTDKLPRLFVGSLFLTFVATPLASAFLSRSPAKDCGLQLLFRCLSLSILGFLVLYAAVGNPAAKTSPAGADAAPGAALAAASNQRRLAVAPGAAQLTPAQSAVRVCFFLWVSLLNLVAVSTLWARSADVFSPEAAGRLFGLLGAGATLGQLLGSLAAGALARAPVLGGGGGAPSLLPLLASAGMLELAGQAAARYRLQGKPAGSSGALMSPTSAARESSDDVEEAGSSGSGHSKALGKSSPAAGGKAAAGAALSGSAGRLGARRSGGGSFLDQLLGRTLEGYRLIRASPYLLHMCAYLALNYTTSSFFYFEKTLVVARVPDAASRTAWFAAINSVSAFFILGLQLLATGRVLRSLGLPAALSVLPSIAGLLMAGIALWPAPASVAAAEVLRKIVAYSLARPARESLFTVVPRAEKYTAKIFLDMVVQRIGDTFAAAAFQALVPAMGFGPSGVAAACVPVCMAWAAVAYHLGLRQQRLAAAAAGAASSAAL
ncbi:hypothetical protein ABPG75_009499 [Micractinium tetrahymenae]